MLVHFSVRALMEPSTVMVVSIRTNRWPGLDLFRPGWCFATSLGPVRVEDSKRSYLVDPASSHMLVSKIKPCMSKYKPQ